MRIGMEFRPRLVAGLEFSYLSACHPFGLFPVFWGAGPFSSFELHTHEQVLRKGWKVIQNPLFSRSQSGQAHLQPHVRLHWCTVRVWLDSFTYFTSCAKYPMICTGRQLHKESFISKFFRKGHTYPLFFQKPKRPSADERDLDFVPAVFTPPAHLRGTKRNLRAEEEEERLNKLRAVSRTTRAVC